MTAYKVVLVGYDGSPAASAAVVWASAEADRRGAMLRVVACYSIPLATDYWGSLVSSVPYDSDLIRMASERSVEAVLATVSAAHPGLTVEGRAVYDSPRQALVEQAEVADVLVVGTTGAGEAKSFVLGSVAHSVARASPCPVVLVPCAEASPLKGRIVVGMDGSAAAEAALDWATDEADLRRAEVVVVHAWTYPYSGEVGSFQARDLTRVDAALMLEEAVAASRARGGSPVESELVENDPAPALVDQAVHADLVVVGSRGRGAFRSMLFGSVAHAVAARSSCPTVVVRAPEGGD